MPGILVYIMGPSGVGKDSLIAYARGIMRRGYALTWNAFAEKSQGLRPICFAGRYITRPAAAGGERHYPLTVEEFQKRKDDGAFALHWASHGLLYGIGREIDAQLACGAVVVVNGSREYLPDALRSYPRLTPVLVTARREVLCSRLEKRGREKPADIKERLSGADRNIQEIPNLITIDNSGTLEEAGRVFSNMFFAMRRFSPAEGQTS